MSKDTSTSFEYDEQLGEDQTSDYEGESSEDDSENVDKDGDTAGSNDPADEYIGGSSQDFEKRYKDSSREAKKLYEEKKELERKYKELQEKVEGSQDNINNQSDDDRLSRLESLIVSKEKQEKSAIITDFESENGITPDLRPRMAKIVKPLVDAGIDLVDALETAWARVSKDPEVATKLQNQSGNYSKPNVSTPPLKSGGGTVAKSSNAKLSAYEYDMAKKMGAIDVNGKVSDSFLKSLAEVRSSRL